MVSGTRAEIIVIVPPPLARPTKEWADKRTSWSQFIRSYSRSDRNVSPLFRVQLPALLPNLLTLHSHPPSIQWNVVGQQPLQDLPALLMLDKGQQLLTTKRGKKETNRKIRSRPGKERRRRMSSRSPSGRHFMGTTLISAAGCSSIAKSAPIQVSQSISVNAKKGEAHGTKGSNNNNNRVVYDWDAHKSAEP